MINILLDRLKTVSNSRIYIFGAASLAVASITLWLALQLSPWVYAMNVHVRLHLQAPAKTKINVCWDKSQTECLPLVPYLSKEQRIAEKDEIADIWLSELPPRTVYTVSLIFKSGLINGIFRDIELDSWNNILWGYIPGAGVQNTKVGLDQLDVQGMTYTVRDGLHYIDGGHGAALIVIREIEPGVSSPNSRKTTIMVWALLFSVFLLFAIPICVLPYIMQNLEIGIGNARPLRYPWWIFVLYGVAILMMLLLAINSPVLFDAYDPMYYLTLAARGDWLSPARPPGYWIFLALALWVSHYDLGGVVLLQAVILALSVITCIWALRKCLHPALSVLFVLFVVFSPAQVHWVLSIMRESLFASLVLLGVSAVIAHFTTNDKLAARIWLAIFAGICALALLVRENGILLPVILLPILFPEALRRSKLSGTIWQRTRSVFSLLVRYAAPPLCTAIVFIALSGYHYLKFGYFQFTMHVTSHHFLWQEIATASFDSRSLLEADRVMSEETKAYLGRQLYRSFILARETKPGLDPIFTSLFPTINQMTVEKGRPVNWFYSASVIDEIGRNSRALSSWKTEMVGMLRQYREFIVSNPADAGGYTLLPDDTAGLAVKRQLLAQLAKSVQYGGRQIEPHSLTGKYFLVTKNYGWYRFLFLFALLAGVYISRYGHPVLLAPITFFVANALLMIMLRTEQSRYIQSLDVLLILQVALGLSGIIYGRLPLAPEKISI